MQPDDIALARIVALGLAGRQHATPADVVRHPGCAQGQDLPGALLSVALRTDDRSLASVWAACDAGEIVRSWPMRGTWHLVAAEDIGWMCALTAPRIFAQAAKRRQELGLDEAMIADASDLVREAIREWARRYFSSHGPATLADFVRWTGMTVADAKRGVGLVHDSLASAEWDGTQYWFARYLLCSPDGRGSGRQAWHDFLPLSLMIRGVLSPGSGGVD